MVIAETQAREAEIARRVAEARERESLRARQAAEEEHKFAERERDLALSQSRISEDRLAQIVGLSDRSVSEVYALLERLPGAVPARHELIHTTLEYLEKLAPEAASNPKLQVALAKAYFGLAELQFNPSMDVDGAEKSYRAGLTFVADAPRAHPHDAERIAVWLRIQNRLGEMLGRRDEVAAEVAHLRRTLVETFHLPAEAAADPDVARNRANTYLFLARTGWPDFHQAREYGLSYLNAVNRLAQRFPNQPDFQFDRSAAMTAVGWTAMHLDDPESAAAYYEEAVRIREKLALDYPADATFRSALMLSYVHLGSLQGSPLNANLGRPDLALQYYLKARPLEEEAASDPKDIVAQASYAAFLGKLGALDVPQQDATASLATLRKAASILEPIVAGAPTYRMDLCNADVWIGHRLAGLGNYAESGAAYNRAAKLVNGILATAPEQADALARMMEAERGLTRVLMLTGDRVGAGERAAETVRRSEEGARRHSYSAFWKSSVAEAYLTLAAVHKTFEEWGEASAAAQRALETAAPLTTGRVWDPNGRIAREARALLADVPR